MSKRSNYYSADWDETHWHRVYLNGRHFDPAPSLALANHSPDGFSWGYSGSGPAQLALAMLLNETGDPELALCYYHRFSDRVISRLPSNGKWQMYGHEITRWLEEQNISLIRTYILSPAEVFGPKISGPFFSNEEIEASERRYNSDKDLTRINIAPDRSVTVSAVLREKKISP